MSKIKVIKQDPGKEPEIVEIENELEALQDSVGGYIQAVPLGKGNVIVICDEEGRLKGKPYNCKAGLIDFVGTILLVGEDGEDFTDVPIGLETWKFYLWLSENYPKVVSDGHYRS